MIRAVFDTMVWVAALRNRRARSAARLILDACITGAVRIVLSRELLRENIEVLLRPKLGIAAEDVFRFGSFLASRGDLVTIQGTPQGCPDPDDDMLFETAQIGNAGYLVSLDKKVLTLADAAKKLGITVITLSDFLEVLRTADVVHKNVIEPTEGISIMLGPHVARLAELAERLIELERDGPGDDPADQSVYFGSHDLLRTDLDTLFSAITDVFFLDPAQARNQLKAAVEDASSFLLKKATTTAFREADDTKMLLGDIDPDGPNRRQERWRDVVGSIELRERLIAGR